MGWILTLLYTPWLCWLLSNWGLFTRLGIPRKWVWTVFSLKLIAGFSYAWVHSQYYLGDTLVFFNYGERIWGILFSAPIDYFRLVFLPLPNEIPTHLQQLANDINYWNETAGYAMVRIQAFLCLFSWGNYPVHVVFWTFGSCVGNILLLNALVYWSQIWHKVTRFYEINQLWWLSFLIPSFLFWFSGVHKEGLSILCLGLILHSLTFLKKESFLIFGLLFGALLLGMVRPYFLTLLVPAVLIFYLINRFKQKIITKGIRPFWGYLSIYFTSFIGIRLLGLLDEKLNVFARVVKIRYYFSAYYNGNSDVVLPPLEPTLLGFLSEMPRAIVNVVFRPFINDVHHLLSFLAFIETYFFIGIWIWGLWQGRFVFYRKNLEDTLIVRSIFWFCLSFALANILLIGLTIDNLGAIVRYRSVAYLFLTVGIFQLIAFKREL